MSDQNNSPVSSPKDRVHKMKIVVQYHEWKLAKATAARAWAGGSLALAYQDGSAADRAEAEARLVKAGVAEDAAWMDLVEARLDLDEAEFMAEFLDQPAA